MDGSLLMLELFNSEIGTASKERRERFQAAVQELILALKARRVAFTALGRAVAREEPAETAREMVAKAEQRLTAALAALEELL